MSRKVLSMVTAIVATLVVAAWAGAAPMKASKAQSIVGTVQKYDAAARTLAISTPKGTETVMVSADTHVMSGSKMLSTGDLSSQTGTRVKVAYTEANGQKTAQSVRIAAVPTKTASMASSDKDHKPAKK